jgi:AraC-like DNA-binding protein
MWGAYDRAPSSPGTREEKRSDPVTPAAGFSWHLPRGESRNGLHETAIRQDVFNLSQTSIVYSGVHSSAVISSHREDAYLFLFQLSGAVEFISSRFQRTIKASTGHAYGLSTHSGMKIRAPAGSSLLAFVVPEPALRENFERLMQRPYLGEFPAGAIHDLQSVEADDLYKSLCHASEDLALTPASCRDVLAKAHEHLILTKLFMASQPTSRRAGELGANRISPRHIQHAEAYMRQSVDRHVTLKDIATASGCSPRALQRHFRDNRGVTPMQVLCSYRLSAAHDAIVSGAARNVTDLAMQLCFSNPGRFSSLYKKAYGKNPSAMIRFAGRGG